MKLLKFGGSSLANAGRIQSIVDIIRGSLSTSGTIAVVASAFQGVTDRLIEISRQAHRGDERYVDALQQLEHDHLAIVDHLLGTGGDSAARTFIAQACGELKEFIHGIWILGEITDRTLDFVMSYGEQLSCAIIAEALSRSNIPAEYVDSRTLIRTDLAYGAAHVNFDLTNWNILNHFKNRSAVQVVTGFIACGPENETTTLGRGGSDYTASIIGAALEAEEIEIWTNVDGVMTADPRMVSSALSLTDLTFEEAMELSHFGAKVIHPPTMLPALRKRIPVRIRNSFHPQFPGTLISDRHVPSQRISVKGIACIEEISLLKVKGEGLLRTIGIASRIFAALVQKDIEVTLVTQSSSEHSICLAMETRHIRLAREVLELEFRIEMHHREISEITVENGCAIIAVVGEQVHNIPGVTGKVFETLGRNGIIPQAIAHGSSERNLTVVVRQLNLRKAMNALHDNLFLSQQKTLSLFLLGPGLVGSALLELLQEQEKYAETVLHIRFRVVGIANSKKMLFDERGIDLTNWRALLAGSAQPSDPPAFSRTIMQFNAANSIVIDATGSEKAVEQYLPLLGASVSIITSSKIANTQSYEFYRRLRDVSRLHEAQFRYSTNVGAALPILDSIRTITQSGDSIERIEAVLSGTLSFIFNSLNAGHAFSNAVQEARDRGFAEPDPRIDLSGTDVARKLLILVREAGYSMEMGEIEIEPYLPQGIFNGSDWEPELRKADAILERRRLDAQKRGCVLLFIARFEERHARIGVEEIGPEHPFYHLSGNDNIVSLTTRTLYRQPLVVRGGGAGAKLTASGLFNDIINVSHSLN